MINGVRQNPQSIIEHFESMKNNFDGFLYNRGEDRPKVRTLEGVKAVDEAILVLQKMEAVPPFTWNDFLFKIAKEHVIDIGRKGLNTH